MKSLRVPDVPKLLLSDLSLREKETAAHSWLIYPEKAYQFLGGSGPLEEISAPVKPFP